MLLPLRDPGSTQLLLFGRIDSEKSESALVEKLAGGCRVVIDIGANIGWYSVLMCRGMEGRGQVFAFEPNPETFPYLRENAMNRPSIQPFEIAVSNSEGRILFYCSKSSALSSAVRNVGREVTVESSSLDEFCRSLELLESVDFVKCDVEGGEVKVLQGARALRSARNSPIWMLEVDEVFLKQAGSSTDEIMREIVQPENGLLRLYYLDSAGKPLEIEHVGDRKGTSNVFIVPEARMQQFFGACI
jgi:FkbM family methyltransferase